VSKFVFVTGGVVSSLGKGITAASLGRLLKNRGLKINMLKIDPYINVDAGTMNPYQHGEVFVTDDGAETDLDLGHYERFVDINLNRLSNVTAGTIYGSVIAKERAGEYLGGTVQVIPHITNEIKQRIFKVAESTSADVTIVEVGGTVGDIEGLPFLEAIRQMRKDVGPHNSIYIHVTLIPAVGPWAESKTKPTQHSVMKLREIGITPEILICRAKKPLSREMKDKISLLCDVDFEGVIDAPDTSNLYAIPLIFEEHGLGRLVAQKLELAQSSPDLTDWLAMNERIENPTQSVRVAIVGKYTELRDAYLSVIEATKHAGIANDCAVELVWFEGDTLTNGQTEALSTCQGLIVPGGFGYRGIEGKIAAIQYARERKIPFLGLCVGLQCAVIEFARNVAGLEDANSIEFNLATRYPVIHLMESQKGLRDLGGTMRLGLWPGKLAPGSLAHRLYGEELVYERHRHRYEFNLAYKEVLEAAGLQCSGMSPDGQLVEIVEIPDHPYFIATQFHPEFKSRPTKAHPLFAGLVEAAIKVSQQVNQAAT
jgi:CTP synthase